MRHLIVLLSCSLSLLVSCGADTGPKIESGGVTESLDIPAGRGFSITADMSVIFAGSPDDQKTALIWNKQVRPLAVGVIRGQLMSSGSQMPIPGFSLVDKSNPIEIFNPDVICDQVKIAVQIRLGSNPITQCSISKLVKRRVSDV